MSAARLCRKMTQLEDVSLFSPLLALKGVSDDWIPTAITDYEVIHTIEAKH